MIDINSITLKNNAMFNIVMRRPNLCKMCLERILGKNITSISYPETERTIDYDINARSIRLDIYCEDEDTVYNIELQNGIYEELPKRSRYYQDLIDIDLLEKGHEYIELKNNIVIFICTFDPFDKGRHLYTFENICIQDGSIYLDDKTSKIFLNTKGIADDIPVPLKNFLNYIDDGEISDDFTKQLDDTVIAVRQDKKWRKKIMTVEQLIKDEAKLARKEGIEEGFKQGIEQGIEQGSEHTLIASIKNLMLNMNISIEQAMDYLDVPADKRDAYMSKINL
ncbi:conserved hypothetical protein (putative transposase or invertase) [Lachnospiraceae bacterium]|nr:conserved hypothetical protein (putative transposase or invertase) [Lachnospiraceae bacterium]